MSTELRRRLLETFSEDDVNREIAWLCARGLLGVLVTSDGLQIRVTTKGRAALAGAAVFHPTGQSPA